MSRFDKAATAMFLVLFVLLVGSCIRWRWNECRGVGHGVAYCLLVDLHR